MELADAQGLACLSDLNEAPLPKGRFAVSWSAFRNFPEGNGTSMDGARVRELLASWLVTPQRRRPERTPD